MKQELQILKSSNQNLENKIQKDTEEQAKLKRQQWWMTALQLRVKTIISKQLEKEQQEAQVLKDMLIQKEHEQDALNEEYMKRSASVDTQIKQNQQLEDKIKQLKQEKDQQEMELQRKQAENESKLKAITEEQSELTKKMKKDNQDIIEELTANHENATK